MTLKRHEGNVSALISVTSTGTLNVSHITLDGGAIWSGDDTATRTNSGLSSATQGFTLIYNNGTLNIDTGAVLENNEYTGNNYDTGGAITNDGILNMTGGTIRRNKSYAGGAVRLRTGSTSFTMSGGKITENRATYAGGAISLLGGTLTINGNAEITNNFCDGMGGAISTTSSVTIGGSAKISGNTIKDGVGEGSQTEVRGNGINIYTSASAVLILSGTPDIRDEVCNSKSSGNVISVVGAFTPVTPVPIMLSSWTAGRVVVTYDANAGTPPATNQLSGYFQLLSTFELETDAPNIKLAAPPPIAAEITYRSLLMVGSRLTALLHNGTAVTYQWQRSSDGGNWADISGATAITYDATVADAGKKIRVIITDNTPYDYESPPVTIPGPIFTITIPVNVPIINGSGSFSIDKSASSKMGTARLIVTVSSANAFRLKLGAINTYLDYTLYKGDTPITEQNNTAAIFTGDGAGSQTLSCGDVSGTPAYSGEYTDTLTFTVELADATP